MNLLYLILSCANLCLISWPVLADGFSTLTEFVRLQRLQCGQLNKFVMLAVCERHFSGPQMKLMMLLVRSNSGSKHPVDFKHKSELILDLPAS